jgi:SAM-dependent methyltransferase
VTRTRFGDPAGFSGTADAYAATMAPSLDQVAAEVVRRAALAPGETVLDAGTGTGIGARHAVGDGRRVIGLDAAAGMLEIARREVPEAEFVEADFTSVPLDDGAVDVVLAVHALLFAPDRVATLAEWRRVTAPDGRLSLSVPGPDDAVPATVFADVYERHGVSWRRGDYPDVARLARWAEEAGWTDVATAADPTIDIRLADEAAFMTWLRVGRVGTDWDADRLDAYARDLMAVAPRTADGAFSVPFGALYLTARRDR